MWWSRSDPGKALGALAILDSLIPGGISHIPETAFDRCLFVVEEQFWRGPPLGCAEWWHGESRPVASNETQEGEDDPEGRAQNRRVEFVLRDS